MIAAGTPKSAISLAIAVVSAIEPAVSLPFSSAL
jgi:hypothetical protein